ncbi:response regulator transcription factor [bacterium]|nr:response regulator transcription factor [bacterium]
MRILLVEDSVRLQRTLVTGLQREGYQVDATGEGEKALRLALSSEYDIIVLDIMLRGMDGLQVLRELRAAGNAVHVLLLTALDTVADRVAGLNSGADDYLVKPFAFEELLARITSLLRRSFAHKSNSIMVGGLEIDMAAHRASFEGRDIELRPREYKVLELLALRRDSIVNRAEIEQRIISDPDSIASNNIDSSISLLRRQLRQVGCPALIRTRRGEGYILSGS